MLHFIPNVLSFFVLLLIFACHHPNKNTKIQDEMGALTKNSASVPEVAKSRPRRSAESPTPVVQEIVVKTLKVIPESVKAELDELSKKDLKGLFEPKPSEDLIKYLKETMSEPFSKVSQFTNPEVREEDGSGFKISIKKKLKEVNDKHVHAYVEEFADGSKIDAFLHNIKGDGEQRKVGGQISVTQKGNEYKLKVMFGNNLGQSTTIQDESACITQKGIFARNSKICYKEPVVIDKDNKPLSGKVYVVYKNKYKKEYDLSNPEDKKILNNLGLFKL